jgi:hypothetical protein
MQFTILSVKTICLVSTELQWGEHRNLPGQQIPGGGEICVKINILSKKNYFLSSTKF